MQVSENGVVDLWAGSTRIKIAVTSIFLATCVGAWAALVSVLLSLGEAIAESRPSSTAPDAPGWVDILITCWFGAMWTGVLGFVVNAVVAAVFEMHEDLVSLWIVVVGVTQFGLGVAVFVAGLDRWWVWGAAAAWTVVAALTTFVSGASAEATMRRHLQNRSAVGKRRSQDQSGAAPRPERDID